MMPLWTHLRAQHFRFEPGDVAFCIFPNRETSRSRQSAEEWNQVWAGTHIDHIKLCFDWRRVFHRFYSALDNAVIVGMRLAIIVLEIGFGIELCPLIVGIASLRWRGIVFRQPVR